MRRTTLDTALTALALACVLGSAPSVADHHHRSAAPDLVDTAVAAGSFGTLAAALEAADLVDTLKGSGPFTVFAPTDEAFAALPEGTVDSLLEPANREVLRSILLFHVVAGEVPAATAGTLRFAETVNGQRLDLAVEEGRLRVDGATVQTADVRASNGLIHVIDRVLLPEEANLVGLAQGAGTFETLLAAAEAAGLAETLSGDAPLTLFAPTDDAFAALPEGTVEGLLAEEGLATLRQILTYHVVEGRVYADDALAARSARTVNGARVEIGLTEGRLRVNDAAIVATDLEAVNGVVHVIDAVLLPPTVRAATEPAATSVRPAEAADRLIRLAVERGVPLFNGGDAAACAAIYEVASTSLLEGGYDLPAAARHSLEAGLSKASQAGDDRARAWALRYGLDGAARSLYERMTSGSR